MWYRAPFRNLSSVQSRQVGSIVSVSLFDAQCIAPAKASKNLEPTTHSYVYATNFLPSLRTLAGNSGILDWEALNLDRLESIRQYIQQYNHRGCHPLYELCALAMPLTCSYPYVSTRELAIRIRAIGAEFLQNSRERDNIAIYDWTIAFQHIILRYLVESKRPMENTALEGVCAQNIEKIIHIVLKEEVAKDAEHLVEHMGLKLSKGDCKDIDTIAACILRTVRFVTSKERTLHEALVKLRKLRNESLDHHDIQDHLDFVILYCASLIGAHFGSRHLPVNEISQIADADLVCSSSFSLMQFSWNPDYVKAGTVPQS